MSSPPATTDWARLRRMAPYLTGDRALYALALGCAPVSAMLTVAQPWLLKVVIDEHIVPGDLEGLQGAALWYLAAVAFAFQFGRTPATRPAPVTSSFAIPQNPRKVA